MRDLVPRMNYLSSRCAPAEGAEAKAAKAPKERKEAFKIDFLSPMVKDINDVSKELFAPVKKGTSINMPHSGPAGKSRKRKKARDKEDRERRDDHLLPDDMHFSSRQLVTLFLKPKFSVSAFRPVDKTDDLRSGDPKVEDARPENAAQ